jgi:hypothetical protein
VIKVNRYIEKRAERRLLRTCYEAKKVGGVVTFKEANSDFMLHPLFWLMIYFFFIVPHFQKIPSEVLFLKYFSFFGILE